ncbi:FecCD family ABC transporter permease [Microbacterium caowuchunii]|uniref:Iron ABC transporter permease n=1 Tax=Microbacterium caowuchunii TaxID=2614638 RepID=A0A5N0TL74_9MICO|nr:iron ABC transporter permease [Microbacterium caowuchunii]KAA9135084.1 iron ABC transporter permease [Microbacterium caowuchunii]
MTPRMRRGALLAGGSALLVVAVLGSLLVGAREIPPGVVLDALLQPVADDPDHIVVLTQRVPRTVIGALAGAALAVAGGLMQGITRNPLADPGLLGVNAGASVAVLAAITFAGITQPGGFVWFAFLGAAVAAFGVYVIGGTGRDGADPAKLALTGAAITAGLTSVSMLILTTDTTALNVYRFWSVGSLTGRGMDVAQLLAVPIVIGILVALLCASSLDLLALGDATARGLGHSTTRTRMLAISVVVLLCGAATAIAGPLVFVGLVVPHLTRAVVGTDYRWIIATAIPLGATLLLVADVIGRTIVAPAELEAGLVVAFLGAPVLMSLVLRRRMVTL